MKTLQLVQGSPEWHAHRALHWNASDAPAMLGVSAHKTRTELLREVHSCIAREFSDYVQDHVIDPGHESEALARPLAEEIIGEELYPCTGAEGRLSASFDGLTLLGETSWEHKSANAELVLILSRDGVTGNDLPEMYRVQMEHQCMVSGATRVLFMVSTWNGDELQEELHCWYAPDMQLRARIAAGWAQFEADLAAYQPEAAAAPVPVGHAPSSLPALRIELTGLVTASNLAEFRDAAIAKFRAIPTDLQTDQDFADAEQTVKWCGDIEDRLDAAKQHALSQTASIDELFRTIDEIRGEARSKRLALDKLVKGRKDSIRHEIVERGRAGVLEHYRAINATLGAHAIAIPPSLTADLANAIKGRKTIASLNDAVDTAAAGIKITASQTAERVRASIAALAEESTGYETLFADAVSLCAAKTPEDLRNLARARIADHRRAELAKQAAAAAALQASPGNDASAAAEPTTTTRSPIHASVTPSVGAAPAPAKVKLGDINASIAPLSITADGLAQIGFRAVGTAGAAKLYNGADFPAICDKLIATISRAKLAKRAA